MKLKTYNITPSVPLDYLGTDKFKKARFSVALSLPADAKNYSAGALLLPLSMRGTESYENFASLCRRCDELYASDISDMASLRGGISMLGLRAQMLDNKYASEKERAEGFDILDGVLGIMSEILFLPRLEEKHIENEKLNLINRIKAQVNDPFGFAMRRLREIMMKGEAGVVTSDEAIAQTERTNREAITAFRKMLIESARVEFFYSGAEPPERVCELIKKHFSPLLDERASFDLPKAKKAAREPIFVDEAGEYGQSNLLIAFRSDSVLSSSDFYASELANEIFGEGPVSKLFLNVREKRSLCYFCGSGYDEINGVLTAGCGIASKDREEAQNEIFAQLENMKKGEISDAEIESAKQAIFSDCLEAEDHPEDYEEFSRMARAFGGPQSIEEYRDKIAEVTREEIAASMGKWKLDTVYFLCGTSNSEEDAE